MAFITLPLLYLILLYLLYRRLAGLDSTRLWRNTLFLACGLGAARGLLAGAGWFVVEHDGGPLQIPGYILAMFAWPEAALLAPAGRTAEPGHYPRLVLFLFGSTVLAVVAVALLVEAQRRIPRVERE